jgi:hypothetical protein
LEPVSAASAAAGERDGRQYGGDDQNQQTGKRERVDLIGRWGFASRSGRSSEWLKMKNPLCEAVRREAEGDWDK